jgi:protein-tyrosine phosphatase
MAEGILRNSVLKMGYEIMTDSAGTGDWHVGEAPDSRAVACMKSKGLDISDLRARQVRKSDFYEFDFILTMDDSNYRNVMAMNTDSDTTAVVRPILEYHTEKTNLSVPDPYFDDNEGFENVYKLLYVALEEFIRIEYVEKNV